MSIPQLSQSDGCQFLATHSPEGLPLNRNIEICTAHASHLPVVYQGVIHWIQDEMVVGKIYLSTYHVRTMLLIICSLQQSVVTLYIPNFVYALSNT